MVSQLNDGLMSKPPMQCNKLLPRLCLEMPVAISAVLHVGPQSVSKDTPGYFNERGEVGFTGSKIVRVLDAGFKGVWICRPGRHNLRG